MNFLDLFVKLKMRLEIGIGWMYWPRQFLYIFIGVMWMLDRFGYHPSIITIIIMGMVGIVFAFLLGHFDLNHFGVYARQQGLQSGLYNDYFKKKLGKI